MKQPQVCLQRLQPAADEAADAGVRGLVQIRVEGSSFQAPKAITDGLSSQQIDDVLTACEGQEVGCTDVTVFAHLTYTSTHQLHM